ncbi:GNAT family N-acetyltransferase [Clostridium ljungdahlii]|uniref:N-acetyltransferase domain-containing protein n=1 Tax=Clostridium ljungdahlii (strain ATCC 55383 / DSM 13528 / PETC) TaxID=748727 RepID=D8GU92_CLOLD|nr:GNAT family N-acetyltransferase [Clostridium ljungdahlii]ADK14755.1 hypothetical protein CLJU_c16910 [Clostridium ljungdahlii DSM 13528]OAA84112.1 hypothetical protein WX45_01956 [Clostridium ljungdahlii DSM 13528]
MFSENDFIELCNIISDSQEVRLYQPKVTGNDVRISQADRTNNILEAEGTVDIVFRFHNEELIISNLFLKHKGRGTGSLIIEWFVSFCKNNNIKKIFIRIVKKDNIIMDKLCKKFGFRRVDNDKDFNDYILELSKGNAFNR